jgi:hypothetical protein
MVLPIFHVWQLKSETRRDTCKLLSIFYYRLYITVPIGVFYISLIRSGKLIALPENTYKILIILLRLTKSILKCKITEQNSTENHDKIMQYVVYEYTYYID